MGDFQMEKEMMLSIHPLTMIRDKERPYSLLERKNSIYKRTSDYLDLLQTFQAHCRDILDIMNENIKSRDQVVKKIRSALKRKDPDALSKHIHNMPEELKGMQGEFRQALELTFQLTEDRKKLGLLISEEYKHNRENLKTFFKSNQNVTKSLYQINRNIIARVKKYVNSERIKPKKLRKLELVLMRIATRGVTKTSPLSRFNKVSFTESWERSEETLSYATDKQQVTINNVFLHRIYEKLSLDAIKVTPFIINTNYYFEQDHILVFTQQSDHNKVYNTNDKIKKIKANRLIVDLLRKYDDKVITYEDLKHAYNLPGETIRTLLNNLFKTGLLKFQSYLSDYEDSINTLVMLIEEHKEEVDEKWVVIQELLKVLEDELAQMNKSRDPERIDCIYDVGFQISQMIDIGTFNELLIYEDYVVQQEKRANDIVSYSDLESIEKLLKLFTLFDVNTKIQLELSELLYEKYGEANVPISDPTLFQHVGNVNMKYSSYWTAPWEEIESENIDIQQLNKLKNHFITLLIDQKSRDVIDISDVEVEQLFNQIPIGLQTKESSYSIFFQKENDDIIINKIYPGYMSFFNRFIRYTDLMQRFKDEIKQFYNEKDRLLEINESFGFNANAYEPFISERLKSDITRDHKVDRLYENVHTFEDMNLKWDYPEFLLENKVGASYKPIISSSLIRVLYPGLISFYSSLFSNISHISELSAIFLKNLKGKHVVNIPEVKMDHLVLDRRKWLIRTDIIPEHTNDELVYAMIDIVRFTKKHDLPEKFYIQKRKKVYTEDSITSISVEFDKPQFIDLNNIILTKVLFNFAKTSDWLLVSEVLPASVDAPEYMTEFNYGVSR